MGNGALGRLSVWRAQNPSPDRVCRAGGFTNGQVRLAILLAQDFSSIAQAATA